MAGDSNDLILPSPGGEDTDALVGVLAVQGDVREHRFAIEQLGFRTRAVKRPADLEDLDALTMPGGESSAMLMALDGQGLTEPLIEFVRSDKPVLATCAGMILCATTVEGPKQRSFGVLDIHVVRNGYGRQIRSGTFALSTDHKDGLPDPIPGVFIRAPRIVDVGPGVEVLARRGADAALVRSGRLFAACFHPELQDGHPVLELFARTVRQSLAEASSVGHPRRLAR
ncbi:MAG: pyridoxal 5'-phosphate synthase glutaminase subunit PdxT [Planctomycetota bacterium]